MVNQSLDLSVESEATKRPKGWGVRYTTTILGFWAMCILYALRFNLSIAIVAMIHSDDADRVEYHEGVLSNGTYLLNECEHIEAHAPAFVSYILAPRSNTSIQKVATMKQQTYSQKYRNGEFKWSRKEQGIILGAFFWGNVLTQIPGGMLAQAYGPKWPIGMGILLTSILTLLTPLAARTGVPYLITVRVLMGLVGGVVWPSMHLLLGKWAPKDERSKLVSIVYAGPQFGTAAATIACGYLIDYDVLGGWPSAFYVLGGVSLLWFVFWCIFVYDTPSKNPRISSHELAYIESSIRQICHSNRLATPWRAIFTSGPLWAILVAQVGEDWGLYTLLTELPTYMDTVLHFNIRENSWMSALPHLARWAFAILLTYFADYLIHKKILRVVTVRKICNTIGHWGAALALIAVSYLGCDPMLAITMLIVAVGINGAVNGGCITNHVDIASNHAGILMGITNTAANVCGILAPYVAGRITNESASLEQWQKVFFVAAAIYGFDNLVYLFFASSTEQSWNRPDSQNNSVSSMNYTRNVHVDEMEDGKGNDTKSSHNTV